MARPARLSDEREVIGLDILRFRFPFSLLLLGNLIRPFVSWLWLDEAMHAVRNLARTSGSSGPPLSVAGVGVGIWRILREYLKQRTFFHPGDGRGRQPWKRHIRKSLII